LDSGSTDGDPFVHRLAAETPRLRSHAARLIARADVDDLVQETLARAWRYRTAFDADKELGPWLRATATRVAQDLRARRGRDPVIGDLTEEPAARAPAAIEEHEHVDLLLARLESIERDVLVRFHRLGQSIAEIATALALPTGTVKSHLHRARRKLADAPRREDRT
jgi:RNA polymerase sigma-70 factor (ECF subfamily)